MIRFPRSAYDLTGGIVYFARMLDKIRLKAAGSLPPEYLPNLGAGFDGRCVRFLGVEYEALCERVIKGGTDADLLEWCLERGRRPGDEEVLIWNAFMTKRGWRDEAAAVLEEYKAAGGFSNREDIPTFFDFFDADEGRPLKR